MIRLRDPQNATSRSSPRSESVWLVHILLLALLLRAGSAALPRVIRWDEPDYLWLGKSLLTGNGYTITGVPELHYTPLLPLLAGAVYLLTGNPELGTSFWYVLLGAALCAPIYYLARRVYGPRVAWLSALLVALFPGLSSAILYWGTMTEPLFIFLVYCALWSIVEALHADRAGLYPLAGGLLGLAYLTRPEGMIWLLSLGALILVGRALRRTLWRWRTLAMLALYALAFVILATPYAAFLHRHTGRWLGTGKLSITYDIGEAVMLRDPVLYDKVTASLDEASGEILWWSTRRFEQSLWDVLLADPRAFAARAWSNLRQAKGALSAPTLFPLFLLAPVVLGWFREPWTRRRLEHEAALWLVALPVISFLPFHVEVRFFAPAFPAMLIWIASGLWEIGDWFAETVAQWRFGDAPPDAPRADSPGPWTSAVVGLLTILLAVYFGLAHVRVIRAGKA
ncbi:MAG: glycosyltransferase family 39 protein, partial [Chloroflexi bacterium]|nr:glycosyltransferase family 39 protein [Chloroflexota bacterium]